MNQDAEPPGDSWDGNAKGAVAGMDAASTLGGWTLRHHNRELVVSGLGDKLGPSGISSALRSNRTRMSLVFLTPGCIPRRAKFVPSLPPSPTPLP